MADKRGTEEAKLAAREARRRRARRKKYEALIEEHPAVKAVRARMIPRAEKEPLKRGVPKLIAEAAQDRDADTAMTAMRRVMKYHHRVGDLARRRVKREAITLKEQKALMRQGESIELDFREMLRSAAKTIRANPATEAYAAAIAAKQDDTDIPDNLPAYLSRSELAAIKYLGVDSQEVNEGWNQIYASHRREVWELLASGKINQALERVEKYAERLEFPEAPRHLVERGVITLGGDAGAVAVVAAVATTVVAVVVTVVVAVVVVAIAVVLTIADLLRDYTVKGTIRDKGASGLGLSNLTIDAYDKDLIADDRLASVLTNSEGYYEFGFNADSFKGWWNCLLEGLPDIFIKVKDTQNRILETSGIFKPTDGDTIIDLEVVVQGSVVQDSAVQTTMAEIKQEIDTLGRTTRHAVTFNPFDEHSMPNRFPDRYEFMITEDGDVVYKKNGENTKYFGGAGKDYNNERKGEDIWIPAVDMIAADGNRVLVKEKDSNQMYFAVMALDEVDDDGKPHPGFYGRKDPDCEFDLWPPWRVNIDLWPSKTREQHEEAITKHHPFGYLLYIPGLWYVSVDETFTWYKIDKVFKLAGETIVDIGVVNINKRQGDYENKETQGYEPIFGGEYHRGLPGEFESVKMPSWFVATVLSCMFRTSSDHYDAMMKQFNLTENYYLLGTKISSPHLADGLTTLSSPDLRNDIEGNKHYGTFCDGISNFYILASRDWFPWSGKCYRVYYIDEQTKASGNWRLIGPGSPAMFSAQESVIQPDWPINQGIDFVKWEPNKHWWDPYDEKTDYIPSLDASTENVILSFRDKIYSINWTFASMDYTWRVREKPEGAKGTYARIRGDMTILIPGTTKDGTNGYYYQKLLPDDNTPPDATGKEVHFPHEDEQYWGFVSDDAFEEYDKNYHFGVPQVAEPPPLEAEPTLEVTPKPTSQPMYVANRKSMEVHKSDCFWVTQMKDTNKVPLSSLGEVVQLIRNKGYNGCFYCLPRYDEDTLTSQQVLSNLEEDLGD